MTFLKVMVMTIAAVFLQGMVANAQSMHPANQHKARAAGQTTKVEQVAIRANKPESRKSTKAPKPQQSEASRQIYCMGQVMANEAKPNIKGWVSVNYALMVRGVSGDYGAPGDFCAAAHAKGQFTAFKKKPTAEMLKVAKQMYNDWKSGKPTIEVALQNQLNGSAYFHNDTVRPDWSRRFKRTMVIEGHYMYRAKGGVSPYSFTLAAN